MSQRLFSTLLAFALFIGLSAMAAYQHVLPPLSDLQNQFFTLVTPLFGVLVTLNAWLDVIDAKVADGSMAAGDIVALFKLPEFWTALVTIGVGAAQTVGLKAIDENEQTMLVNILLLLSTIVLRSFSDRTPTNAQTVKAASGKG